MPPATPGETAEPNTDVGYAMTQPSNLRQTRERRTVERHRHAWQRFTGNADCPYCGHDFDAHALLVGQPHYYRLATDEELEPFIRIRHLMNMGDEAGADAELTTIPGTFRLMDSEHDELMVIRRITVRKLAEVQIAECTACAEIDGRPTAVCYQATEAVGELVGVTSG